MNVNLYKEYAIRCGGTSYDTWYCGTAFVELQCCSYCLEYLQQNARVQQQQQYYNSNISVSEVERRGGVTLPVTARTPQLLCSYGCLLGCLTHYAPISEVQPLPGM